jgi:hypothetical protein
MQPTVSQYNTKLIKIASPEEFVPTVFDTYQGTTTIDGETITIGNY